MARVERIATPLVWLVLAPVFFQVGGQAEAQISKEKRAELEYYGPLKKTVKKDKSVFTVPAKPTPQQLAFMDLELGLFIHFGLSTYTGQISGDGKQPASRFNPTGEIDCDQWMEAAKRMGAKYAVLTARHEGGFCLWQTGTTEYSVKNSPWKNGKGDVVKEYVQACRRAGIKVGIYHTSSHDNYHSNLIKAGKLAREQYAAIQVAQIEELFTNYGRIDYIWQDHHSGTELWKAVDTKIRRLQPDCVIFGPDTWIAGGHSGWVAYPLWYAVNTTDGDIHSRPTSSNELVKRRDSGQPDGQYFRVWEANTSVKGNWFNGPVTVTLAGMLDSYYRTVGHGANFLVNFAPSPDGKMGDDVLQMTKQFGDIVRKRFGNPLGTATAAEGMNKDLMLKLPKNARVDHVIVRENLKDGQRVTRYRVLAKLGNWQQLTSGLTIGHKKIHRIDPPVTAAEFRLAVSAIPGSKPDDVEVGISVYGQWMD